MLCMLHSTHLQHNRILPPRLALLNIHRARAACAGSSRITKQGELGGCLLQLQKSMAQLVLTFSGWPMHLPASQPATSSSASRAGRLTRVLGRPSRGASLASEASCLVLQRNTQTAAHVGRITCACHALCVAGITPPAASFL